MARMTFETTLGKPLPQRIRREGDDPFRILVVGDFAGEASRAGAPRPIRVDIDNLEEVLGRVAPRCTVRTQAEGGAIPIAFSEYDDFHPDALFDRVEGFAGLTELKRRALEPGGLDGLLDDAAEAAAPEPASAGENLSDFEKLVGGAVEGEHRQRRAAASRAVDKLLQGAVAPHVVPGRTSRQDELAASIDEAMAATMRAVLHAPDYQRLEALWQAVRDLVTGIELDEALQLSLLDADVTATATPALLERWLIDEAEMAGEAGWSVVIVDHAFGADAGDLHVLARLGHVAARGGAALLAGASPRLVGGSSAADLADPERWTPLSDELADAWSQLRRSAVAPSVGLVAPRVLGRLPYGESGEEIDRFPFEELDAERRHDDYLWGNAAFACARLLGQSFSREGWSMRPDAALDVAELPSHTFVEDGESKQQACGEVYFSERVAEAIAGHGVMPLLSYRNRNAVRLAGFRSIADPATPLAGPWNA